MRRIGPAMALAAATLVGAPGAWAQSEMEMFHATATQLQNEQRGATQNSIAMATRALREKDYAAARKYAQPVTRADPKRVESWLLLGAAQMGLQDWKAARATYTTAVRVSPLDAEARAGLGVAMARTKDPRATIHLAWLTEKAQACGGCWQASQLAKLKTDVETAIAETAKPS